MKDWELEMHLEQIKSAQERTIRAQEEANRIARNYESSYSNESLGLSWKTKLKIISVIVVILLGYAIFTALVYEYEAELNVIYEKCVELLQNLTSQFQ